MKVTEDLTKALGRKRGELNISVLELARQTGVSRWTLDRLLHGQSENINPTTLNKLNGWLYEHV
ncbi:helix-turn-helix transcriptional regulator [Lactiplantibacillus plantarum]|uniref:helix-turn-helix domain-containing protein n=1 Tax=Lactiplantibacillus plantarum TaxID=1590 RepID=UPI00209D0898|nr:helix-turn-helix transcriptional regulator [Lactiplantibacillus plantarum]USZ60693.1 helix-turn-helix transcriptional regulator [Lactiplantibacillus plantarum]